MKFVADEGVDLLIVENLRRAGHTIWYVAEMAAGIADDQVLEIANQESAQLLTTDKDFGELLFRQKRISSGIVLLRLAGLTSIKKAEIVTQIIKEHGDKIPQMFTVISPGLIRIRRQDS